MNYIAEIWTYNDCETLAQYEFPSWAEAEAYLDVAHELVWHLDPDDETIGSWIIVDCPQGKDGWHFDKCEEAHGGVAA